MTKASLDIGRMTPEEKLDLLDQLWESLSGRPEDIPLTPAQREDLDQRLEALEREGPVGIPWEEVLRRLHDSGP